MRRTHQALATLALSLALIGAATAVAAAAMPPAGTQDQADQRRAMYQSELERNLRQRTQADNQAAVEQKLAAQRKALYQSERERTLARHRALGALDAVAAPPASAARPAARTAPARPGPDSSVDVPATLLVGLVGGLLGGAAVLGIGLARHHTQHT